MNTHRSFLNRAGRRYGAATAVALALTASPATARGVNAGTLIDNTATATFADAGQTTTITSNTVSLKVDEVIDVAVAVQSAGQLQVRAGQTGAVRSFTLTNIGNGSEAFVLNAIAQPAGGFSPVVTGLAIDSDGDGRFDPAIDTVIANGATSVVLAADTTLTVFVLSDIPAGAADGQIGEVRLTATARTGTGAPGTVFAGQGDGGGDAIVGASRAEALATAGFIVQRAAFTFTKSATVADPFGGSRVVPGAIVAYRLVATVSGNGAATGLTVGDTIPSGTTYQPGTLTLEGVTLTDAADGDAGSAGGSGIAVALGDVGAGLSRTVVFKVKIN